MSRQRAQRQKAQIIVNGFSATGARADVVANAGEAGDEVHVKVDGIDPPIRILPGRGGVVFPSPEFDEVAYFISLDLAAAN